MDEKVVPPKNCAQEASKKNTPWRKMLKELKMLFNIMIFITEMINNKEI